MAERMGIYKCEICGNVVEVFVAGGGQLVCCGKEMKYRDEKLKDGALEKHLPVVEVIDGGIKVKVGETEHPSEDKHYIQFIEVITKAGIVLRKDLYPGNKPEAEFNIAEEGIAKAREHCNIHGLWAK